MREHRVDDAGGEDAFAHIPINQDAAVEFGDLRVQQHLRPLGDDPSRCAELAGHVGAEQLAESERAGEDDGREHLGAAMTAEVTKDRQTGIGRMGGGGAHRVLHHLGPCRRGVRAGEVDVEQQRGGEVTDQESTSGCSAWRPNSGTFSRKREVVDQRASVLANPAASAIAG